MMNCQLIKNFFIYLSICFLIHSCNENDPIVYDYSYIDVNTNSQNYNNYIGPGYFENQITLHYFGHQD